jgi:hypothetical protein
MYARDVENKSTTRNNVYPKVLREGRDLEMILLYKKKPLQKERMCTWILQAHMHIMRHGKLN